MYGLWQQFKSGIQHGGKEYVGFCNTTDMLVGQSVHIMLHAEVMRRIKETLYVHLVGFCHGLQLEPAARQSSRLSVQLRPAAQRLHRKALDEELARMEFEHPFDLRRLEAVAFQPLGCNLHLRLQTVRQPDSRCRLRSRRSALFVAGRQECVHIHIWQGQFQVCLQNRCSSAEIIQPVPDNPGHLTFVPLNLP